MTRWVFYLITLGVVLSSACASQESSNDSIHVTIDPAEHATARSASVRSLDYDISKIRPLPGSKATYPDGRVGEIFQNPNCQCLNTEDPKDPDSRGFHEFMVLNPVDYDQDNPKPSVVHIVFTGGGFGWIDKDGGHSDAPGTYMGMQFFGTVAFNRRRMRTLAAIGPPASWEVGARHRLALRIRAEHPDWTILIPSYCSHDLYGGRGTGEDFPRYGWIAVASAVRYLKETRGIRHVFAEGSSAGGSGSVYVARDLEDSVPGVKVRGVVVASQAYEPEAYGWLYDSSRTRKITLPDGRTVEAPCESEVEPVTVGLTYAGVIQDSTSSSILNGEVEGPIFHLWNRRDATIICSDEQYSDEFLNGAIARAIVEKNPGGRSMLRRVCVTTPGSEIPCNSHGLIGLDARDEEAGDRNPDYVAEAFEWINRLHTDWENATTHPALPGS